MAQLSGSTCVAPDVHLVPHENIPRIEFFTHIAQFFTLSIGDDDVRALLEGDDVVHNWHIFEILTCDNRLIDNHLDTPFSQSADNTLDRRLAEVVRAAFHSEAVDADGLWLARQYHICHVSHASSVGVDDAGSDDGAAQQSVPTGNAVTDAGAPSATGGGSS